MKIVLVIEYQGKELMVVEYYRTKTNCPVSNAFMNWKHRNKAKGAKLIRGY